MNRCRFAVRPTQVFRDTGGPVQRRGKETVSSSTVLHTSQMAQAVGRSAICGAGSFARLDPVQHICARPMTTQQVVISACLKPPHLYFPSLGD